MGSSKKHKDKDKERDRDRKRDKDRRHRKRSRSRDRDEDRKDRREYRESDSDKKKKTVDDQDDLFDKLRAKLGLKPLKVDDGEEKTEEKKTALLDDVHMRRKLEEIREKRKIHQKLVKVKTLGEEDSDDESASAWVKKNRKNQKEKEMAEKRVLKLWDSSARMLEEMDAEFGVGDLINEEFGSMKRKSYTSRDLKGLTVEHDQTGFKEGTTTILTLKDQGILDDEGDTLHNVNMGDFEKAKKNQDLRKKKSSYQPYDEVDENDMFKVKGVLDKYDEEIEGEKKKVFALGSGGQFDTSREDDLEKIKARLRNEMVSLEMAQPRLASEYYTEEEMLKFKKPKKKRKIRKREVLKADALESISGSYLASGDHGSRNTKSKPKAEQQQTNFGEEAMDIAPLEQDDEEYYYNQDTQDNNLILEDDEAQLELEVALQRSRLAKKKKEKVGVEKMVQDLAAATKQEQSTNKDEASIVIDSTSEFCRALGDIPTYGAAGNREEEEEEDDADWRMDLDQPQKDAQGGWELVQTQEEKKKVDADKLEEESRVLDEEPIVGSGMAAALLLASKKGLLNAPGKQKREEKFVAELPSVGVIDEEKMSGEGKDRSRSGRDRDYERNKDRYGVEKEGYIPKVKLDYVDEHGRQMTPKEAFRYLSHRFHGKMPAKMKTEKRAKKVHEDIAMQKMSSVDTPLNTAALLKDKQKESQSPYLILSGGGNTFSSGTTLISKKK
ncbi:U4/U6.U5 tri-snRNP-associated protein 1 [Exaiptasia diaphana]|nr:U4/U6.U5 tri-snRNP-associated protein 1 [Exaiptasia diaphana]